MKYFVSDLHIMDGGQSDEFNYKSDHLVSLVEKILDEQPGGEHQELILLGDIIDFLEIECHIRDDEDSCFSESALHKLEEQVYKAHPDIFIALSEFLKRDNSLFYVWGNHDYPMRFGSVNEALAQRILSKTRDRTDYGKFTVSDYYLSRRMMLYAEHGHIYDPYNVHRNGSPPVGTLLMREFIKKWSPKCYPGRLRDLMGAEISEEFLRELGVICGDGMVRPFALLRAIRPRGAIFSFIERLLRYGVLDRDPNEELVADLAAILENAGMNIHAQFINLTTHLGFKNLRDAVLKARFADDTPKVLRKAAKEIFKMAPYSKDMNYMPRICVMGHSHFTDARIFPDDTLIPRIEDYRLEPDKKYYINLGTWINHCLINEKGIPGSNFRECPYLRLRRDRDGAMFADLRDAACPDHSSIDVAKHRMRYTEYNTAFE